MNDQARARSNIERLTKAFASATDQKPTGVLDRALKDSRFLERTADGTSTFTFRVYENGIRWFSDNWPAAAEWPADIERPKQGAEPTPTPEPAQ